MSDYQLGIPIIHMEKLSEGLQREEEIKKIATACEEWGFFQVVNHGIPNSLIDAVKRVGKAFFHLPLEEKQKHAVKSYGQTLVVSEEQKLKWGDLLGLIMFPSDYKDLNVWPVQPTDFREIMDAYNTETKSLARTLLSLIPETLQLKPDFFEKKFGNPNQRVRMNYYPQYPKPDRSYLRPHPNMTGTTLLPQHDEILGLNIRKDDRWIAVQPIPYALVLNVGKLIEVTQKTWSNQFRPSESEGVVCMENKKLPAVDNVSSKGVHSIDMSEMDDANHIGKQQPPAAPVNPDDEDDYLKQEISALVVAYDKYTDEIYTLLSLGATMHEPALMAVFTGQHYKGAIILSVIVSGVIVALLRIYRKQFRLLRRLRPLIQNRNSLVDRCRQEGIGLNSMSRSCTSGMSVHIAEEADNLDFWWPAERATVVVILVAFLICLWLY